MVESGCYLWWRQVVTVCPGFVAPCWAVSPPAGELQCIHRICARFWLHTHHKHIISVDWKVKVSKHVLLEFLSNHCTALVPVVSSAICPLRDELRGVKSGTLLADCIWKSANFFPAVSLSFKFSTALWAAFSTDASSQKTFTGSWRSRETEN